MKKQIIASALALGTMMSSFPAFAVLPQEIKGTRFEKAVSVLSALEIMNGDENGEFRLDDTIIRSELTKMAITAMGMEDAADSHSNTKIYDDVTVDHWANGYISLATSMGIVEGDGDGKFRPNDKISYREAVTIMVRAAGYESAAKSKGGYPKGYINVANENSMLKGVEGSSESQISRGNVAILTNNTLEIKKMQQTGFGSTPVFSVVDKTLLGDNLKTEKITGQIKAVGKMSVSDAKPINDNQIMIDDKVYESDYNASGYLGYNVTGYVKKDGDHRRIILVMPVDGRNSSIELTPELFVSLSQKGSNDAVEYYETENSTKTKTAVIDKEAKLIYNNRNVEYKKELINIKDKSAYLTMLDSDSNSVYDIIFVNEYQNIVVDSVSSNKINGTKNEVLDLEEIKYKLYQGIDEIEAKNVSKWDVLSVIKSPTDNYHEIYLTRKTVKGKISSINKNSYTIDDVAYKASVGFNETMKLGQYVELCLDINGDIAAIKNTQADTKNYAYLTNIYELSGGESVEVKLFDKASGKLTLPLAKKIKLNSESVTKAQVLDAFEGQGGINKQLITYSKNQSGEITQINIAKDSSSSQGSDSDAFTMDKAFENSVYSATSSKLDNIRITNDTIVFDVSDTNNIKVSGKNSFSDKQKYTGLVYDMSESLEAGVIVLTASSVKPEMSAALAIVKSISTGVNSNDDIIDIATLLINGKEEKLNATSDNVLIKEDGKKIEIGDIIQYKTNDKGEIEGITVLFDVSDSNSEFMHTTDSDVIFIYGRVTKKFSNSLNVSVEGKMPTNYEVNSDVIVYSVDTSSNKNNVSVSSFEDIGIYDSDTEERVFIKKVDEIVKEIVIIK